MAAAFDIDASRKRSHDAGVKVLAMGRLSEFIRQRGIKMAILTVPGHVAQEVTNGSSMPVFWRSSTLRRSFFRCPTKWSSTTSTWRSNSRTSATLSDEPRRLRGARYAVRAGVQSGADAGVRTGFHWQRCGAAGSGRSMIGPFMPNKVAPRCACLPAPRKLRAVILLSIIRSARFQRLFRRMPRWDGRANSVAGCGSFGNRHGNASRRSSRRR